MSRFRFLPLLFVLLFTAGFAASAAAPRVDKAEKNLPALYRHWLDEEVPYIIQTQEREQFLALHTDAERDSFINSFWQARNPTPGSETNSYKDEHYRRLAYANEHYGSLKLENGWRTDQGRIYITLGAPQSVATYPSPRNVRPLHHLVLPVAVAGASVLLLHPVLQARTE